MRLPFELSSRRGLLRHTPVAAIVALSLWFCVGFADGVLAPFLALWAQRDAGVATAWIGLLLACYSGGELLATPLLGGLADRIGRRPVLLGSFTGVGLGFILLCCVHGLIASVLVLVLIGVFESVLHPTIATVLADVVPRDRARHFFSLARVMAGLGRIVGPALGAWFVLRSLGTVFVAAGMALLFGAVVVLLWLPETWRRGRDGARGEDDDESLAGLLPAFRDPRLAGLLFWTMCLEICAGWVGSVLPLYASDTGALTVAGVGLLFTYAAVLVVVFQFGLTRVLADVRGYALVLASGVALAFAFVLLLLVPGVPGLVLGVTLLALADMLIGPLLPATINELAPPRARATYMAAASVTHDLNDSVGPAIGTFLYAASARLPWLLGVPLALGASIVLAASVRRHERATASAESAAPPQHT